MFMPDEGKTSSDEAVRCRRAHVLRITAQLLLIGIAYYIFVSLTGLAVPCLIRTFTGFQCPGCGITRMCICLSKLDLAGAFAANPFILCLLPAAVPYILFRIRIYIQRGPEELSIPEMIILSAVSVGAVIFGVWRNL